MTDHLLRCDHCGMVCDLRATPPIHVRRVREAFERRHKQCAREAPKRRGRGSRMVQKSHDPHPQLPQGEAAS